MDKIKINGKRENIKTCLDCNRVLTSDEYNTCHDKCVTCYSNNYNPEYVHIDGTNDIYKILQNKIERR